jgi:hypothetical protein
MSSKYQALQSLSSSKEGNKSNYKQKVTNAMTGCYEKILTLQI